MAQTGWKRWIYGPSRARTKGELVDAMNAELERDIPGITWNFSQNIRDNVMEALSGVKGDNSLKIFGPDLDQLELLAEKGKEHLARRPGVENVGIFHVRGHVAPGVSGRSGEVPEVGRDRRPTSTTSSAAPSAPGPCPAWSKARSCSTSPSAGPSGGGTARRRSWISRRHHQQQGGPGAGSGFTPNADRASALPPPTVVGSLADTSNPISSTPRLRLRDLVSPVGEDGSPGPQRPVHRAGDSTIYREQGKRLIAIKFSVRGRDLGSAVDEAKARTKELFKSLIARSGAASSSRWRKPTAG